MGRDAEESAAHPSQRPSSRHRTSPLTVGIHLRNRWSAWR
jgi:hypothetical protein